MTSPILIMDPFPPPDGTSFYVTNRSSHDNVNRTITDNRAFISTFFRTLDPGYQPFFDEK